MAPIRNGRGVAAALLLALLGGFAAASPAAAHRDHPQQRTEEARADEAKAADVPLGDAAAPDHMREMMADHAQGMERDRAALSFGERLLDWLGRLHPILVHFPLAFLPAALLTAIAGRRRPAFEKPVQFLVIAGGLSAPVAAALGWFSAPAALADAEPLLTVHRWLGTGIGAAGLALAAWAWRRPEDERGWPMLGALSAVTAAIIVQGWYGGALVHGPDHLAW